MEHAKLPILLTLFGEVELTNALSCRRKSTLNRPARARVWYYGINMARTKVTFTLDSDTVARLRRAAERVRKPQSQVVREAIYDYSERIGRLSERERLRMLKILREIIQKPPTRPTTAVDDELKEIRRARRQGGRRSATDR